jgi:aldose 1-epimerase
MILITEQNFGVLSSGEAVKLWSVDNGYLSFSACDYGCLLTSILLPAKNGGFDDILLGFSTLDGYVHRNTPYFGALVGRCANRISGAAFTLNGVRHTLDANYGPHSLHGGFRGYHQMMWRSRRVGTPDGAGVCFTRRSPAGEQGCPGSLELEVYYLLNERNELIIRATALCDADTPVNLTNHSYFNLKGAGKGTVGGHTARIPAARYLEVDADLIPTGKVLSAAGTVFDFSKAKEIGRDFGSAALGLMKGGYDVCYCFDDAAADTIAALPLRAEISEPQTGRTLICRSNQPCLQLYTGCSLDIQGGKDGASYPQYSGFCLETQGYTNAPNISAFPSSILKAGERYESLTVYSFS